MIATFLYRIGGEGAILHGKYVGPCPVYEEGLDHALRDIFSPLFHQFYGVDESEVYVGVLFVDREGKDYYSEGEKHVFDVLYCKWPAMEEEIYFCGKAVKP